MSLRSSLYLALLVFFAPGFAAAHDAGDDSALHHSVDQLRTSIGLWDVTTEFLNPDGSVARTVTGTYEFDWVVPDRVVSGKSDIPELNQVSAILFYVKEAKKQIEMLAVGGDGNLWIMTGELGQEVRTSQEFETTTGGVGQLRFTRYNVSEDNFESKMDYTEDGGKTWTPGNHQVFRRAGAAKD